MDFKFLLLDKRRWIQLRQRLKTEEFDGYCLCFRSNSLPLRVLPLIQEGECFFILFLLLKRRWIQLRQLLKTEEFCSSRYSGTPSPCGDSLFKRESVSLLKTEKFEISAEEVI